MAEADNNQGNATQTEPAKAGKGAPPAPTSAKFIFIGDPNDSGAGPRAFAPLEDDEDDDDLGTGPEIFTAYGIKFPKGKAVDVPLDAVIGNTNMSVVAKLRGSNHFFEGDEKALDAAKRSGRIVFKKAPKKTPMLTKFKGMKMKRVRTDSGGVANVPADGEE